MAPGFAVFLKVSPEEYFPTLGRMDKEFGFDTHSEPSKTYFFIPYFLRSSEFARLRSDPAVKFIEYNATITIG
jgi:hypothetical protein